MAFSSSSKLLLREITHLPCSSNPAQSFTVEYKHAADLQVTLPLPAPVSVPLVKTLDHPVSEPVPVLPALDWLALLLAEHTPAVLPTTA